MDINVVGSKVLLHIAHAFFVASFGSHVNLLYRMYFAMAIDISSIASSTTAQGTLVFKTRYLNVEVATEA
jgi:hypothetical protein